MSNSTDLKRVPYIEYRTPRATFFYDVSTGELYHSGKIRIVDGSNLCTVLDAIQEYTIADNPKQRTANLFFRSGMIRHYREVDREYFKTDTWKLEDSFKWDSIQAKYEKQGFTIWLYGTGKAYGEHRNINEIQEAHKKLEKVLASSFHLHSFSLRSSPAQTGKALLEISLPHVKEGSNIYQRLPDDLIELIKENSYQGRVEHFVPNRKMIHELFILDARWMYAACIAHLPTGLPVRDTDATFLYDVTSNGRIIPSIPGFYRVVVTVPDNWHHIGLVKGIDQGKGTHGYTDAIKYPREPGTTIENWITADELALLICQGWKVRVLERVLFPDTHKHTDPLSNWLLTLKKLRIDLDQEYTRTNDVVYSLMSKYVRLMVLHVVGSFHSTSTVLDHTSQPDMLREDTKGKRIYKVHGRAWTYREKDIIYWKEEVPLSEASQKWIKPEWSATAWGRARVRLANFALKLPYADIVSLYVDCVYSASCPDWLASEDTGKPGAFRLKGDSEHDVLWPDTWPDMREFIIQRNDRLHTFDPLIEECTEER